MNVRAVFLSLLSLLAGTATLHAQAQFIPMPAEIFSVNDITPDGTIIVGSGTDPSTGNGSAYYWQWQTDPSPTYIGGNGAVAVSDDGQVITGSIDDMAINRTVAGVWTPTTGWFSLGYLPGQPSPYPTCGGSASSAYDISGDGTTVVGLSWAPLCDAHGFIWTQATGLLPLESLGNGGNRASAISRDGSVIGGFCQGSFSRSPTIWDPANPPTGGTAFDLSVVGEVRGVSDDGSVLLGSWGFGAADGKLKALIKADGGAPINLGSLNFGWAGASVSISTDRSRICGFDYLGLGTEAWVWDAGVGIVSLQQKLIQAGVAGVPFLGACRAMTPDGSIIVGNTTFQGSWIAILPTAEAEVYGCGLNPPGSMQIAGVPTLGSVVTLGLDNPLGTQTAGAGTLLLVGFAPQPTFPCGLPTFDGSMTPGQPGELLVSPVFFLPGLPWAGTGTPANFPIPIPTSPPTVIGLTIYCQGAILDPSTGINGLTDAARLTIGLF